MSNFSAIINTLAVAIIPIMLGMICHEVAHGWVAMKMGDPTAKRAGRLTINPLAHLEFLGTAVFVITAVSSALMGRLFIFGWAKPVPINPSLFRNFRKGLFMVSIAGAATNLLLALGFAAMLKLRITLSSKEILHVFGPEAGFFTNMCAFGIFINCTLAFFNLLPVPPLDGSKVLGSLLPAAWARQYFRLARYGMIIILLLLATRALDVILFPLVETTAIFFLKLVGLG